MQGSFYFTFYLLSGKSENPYTMKTVFLFLTGILLFTIFPSQLFSQCAGGIAPFTITYDTTVIGNGNGSYSFSFPKFNPSLGTFISADLKSVVTLKYSYTLENQTVKDTTFKTKILRTDDISSPALDPSSVTALNQTPNVTSLIPAHQLAGFGPNQMSYTITNSVTDGRLINFMGVGSIIFDYETGSAASVQGPIPWLLNFTAVTDTTHFSITYRYCSANLLSSDLLFFTAIPQSKGKVLLNWRQAAVEPNRVYSVQVSTDGITFTTLSNVTENTSGVYEYSYLNSSAKKLFFRIQERNISGEIKYSNIRMVEFDQGTKTQVNVFPTFYTGGSLQVNFPEKNDWQIILYAADGRKISEARQNDVYNAQLQVPGSLGNGVYLVVTLNTRTQQRQTTRIIVQR